MERDNDLEKKKEDIQEMIRNTQPFSKLNTEMCNKDITILLGRTRAGKSTLANYLLGYKLRSVKEELGNTYKLEKMLHTGQGPQIGKGTVSTTSIPTVPTLPDGGILIDSPGFEDNRGISQDIFNAICINHIRFANSVKFVLVCYIGDLVNDNIQNFTTLLKKMADLVVNVENIYKSVCIIFTKDQNNVTLDQLRKFMEDNILKEKKLAVDKRLLPILLKNRNLIGIFKSPTREGEIFVKQLDDNVKKAIDACSYVNVNNLEIQFPLADESKIFLKEIYLYYMESTHFESEIERTIECIINYLDVDDYVYASYGKELHVVNSKVLKPLAIELNMILKNVINNLEELKVALEAVLEVRKLKLSTEFKSHFAFILLLDNALLVEEYFQKLVINKFKDSTSKLLDKILLLIDKIDDEYRQRIDENILLLYEANNFKYGINTFHICFELAKAKIINSVQTDISNPTPDTEPLMPKEHAKIVISGVDIGKVADAIVAGAVFAKSTIAKAAAYGATAGAVGVGVTGGSAASSVGTGAISAASIGVAATGAAATAAGAAGGTAASAAASAAGAVSATTIGAVVTGGTGFGAAVAGAAGAATTGTAVAGAAASGAATSGTVAIGATALGAVACGAGIFAAGVAISSVYCSMQYCLTNRFEMRCKQDRDKNNEKYIPTVTTL